MELLWFSFCFHFLEFLTTLACGLRWLQIVPHYQCTKLFTTWDSFENCRAPSLYVFHITVWLHFKKKKDAKWLLKPFFYVFISWNKRDQERGCCGFCAAEVLRILMNQPTSNSFGILNHCKNLEEKVTWSHLFLAAIFVRCGHQWPGGCWPTLMHLFGHVFTPFRVKLSTQEGPLKLLFAIRKQQKKDWRSIFVFLIFHTYAYTTCWKTFQMNCWLKLPHHSRIGCYKMWGKKREKRCKICEWSLIKRWQMIV